MRWRVCFSLLLATIVAGLSLVGCGSGSGAVSTTLSLTPIPAKAFGASPFTVSATSNSPASIVYSVASGPATIAGSTLTLTGVGSVAVSASQAASGKYSAASTTRTFTVSPGAPVLAFAPIATKSLGDAPFTVSATSASTGAVTYAVTSGPATLSGNTVTLTGAGSVVLTASQAADNNYLAATASTTLTVNPAPATTATLSASSFDFGDALVGSPVTKQVVTVTNTGASTLYLGPALSGDASYSITAGQSCGTALVAGASCAITAVYSPTVASSGTPQTATLNLHLVNGGTSPQTVALTGMSGVLSSTVTSTNHPQVAQYSVTLPFPGSVTISFGPTTAYGRQTWSKSTGTAGTINILVAGMLANSTYHMQATVQFTGGNTGTDTDHTFTTGTPPFPVFLSTETTSGMTPQPGVEQLSIYNAAYYELVVADLQGNTLWSYVVPGDNGGIGVEGAKMMSNGDFLVTLGQGSSQPLVGSSLTNYVAVREIDLAGNTVKQITAADLSQKLQAKGYNISLEQFHHDVIPMTNGHWIVLANYFRSFTDLPGYPGTTRVLGDVIVDLDENLNPAWVWDEFDHLDVNRHPYMFPDWTHTNAVVYSPTDGNLLVSMRHQNWVLKIDYANGGGAGDILWHLGEGGDFTLTNGTDPTDWNYAQHFPSFFSKNTAGVFSLGLMDNGDDREFPSGVQCGTANQPACQYTTIPVFQLDENAKTATFTFHQILPTTLYSFFGGNTEQLDNGNVEYDLAGVNMATGDIFEVTQTSTPQTVWHMHATSLMYRGYRIPSLYPGVQW